MKPLDHPITLRMKTGCLDPGDSEDKANLRPDPKRKLEPLSEVRGARTPNLGTQEVMKAVAQTSAILVEIRNSLRPSVNHGED